MGEIIIPPQNLLFKQIPFPVFSFKRWSLKHALKAQTSTVSEEEGRTSFKTNDSARKKILFQFPLLYWKKSHLDVHAILTKVYTIFISNIRE